VDINGQHFPPWRPPRKRRAAAVAAQKNWTHWEEDNEDITEDDIIYIETKETSVKKSVPNNWFKP